MLRKPTLVFLISSVVFSSLISRSCSIPKGVNGGVRCLGCTAIVSINQQLAEHWNTTFAKSYHKLCSFLPPAISTACFVLGKVFLPVVLPHQFESPDVICHAIALCYTEKGRPECKAYPKSNLNVHFKKKVQQVRTYIKKKVIPRDSELGNDLFDIVKDLYQELGNDLYQELGKPMFDICTLPGVRDICRWLRMIFGQDLPVLDLDGDRFSSYQPLRGFAWRGKDCNDFLKTHYPGRKPISGDVFFDSNCNGIHGLNLVEWKTWEEILCEGTGPLGTIALGDSITAHFRIPPEWLTATEINETVFRKLVFVLENEFDWPMMSAYTGYLKETDWPQIIMGPIDSIYKHVVKRNLCNHRDYQNIGKNGADSFDMNNILVKALARKNGTDQPVLLFYSLFGNDVCHSTPDVANMTTPEQMRTNALKTMDTLDNVLPNGSHVVMLGLADGRVLYDSMHNRIHPIGKLRKDVTYAQLYDFLNCLEVSPCAGWMNSNETIRNATTERANELSKILQDIAETRKYRNFDLVFIDNFFPEVIRKWKASGKDHETWQLIEPVDGFHPNQHAMALSATVLVETIESKVPHFLGRVNPNNARIKELFGDQGGYN